MVLTQKMKDFIAYKLTDDNWKDIIKMKLSSETDNRIRHDNDLLYDKAYATVRELIHQGIVRNWCEMKNILKEVNPGIIDKFTKKFSSKQPAPG